LGAWSPSPGGVIAGIQLGYNLFAGSNWLFGIEGEFDWTSAQGNVVIPNPVAAATFTSNHRWYDTFGGRFGFFQGSWLYYFKGGAAWLDADYRLTGNFSGVTTLQSVANIRSGWNVGAGFEYMWAPNWSAKVEYNFLDFGTQNLGFGALGATVAHRSMKSRWASTIVGCREACSGGSDRMHMRVQAEPDLCPVFGCDQSMLFAIPSS
jgi:opacity protein-like surface antigen